MSSLGETAQRLSPDEQANLDLVLAFKKAEAADRVNYLAPGAIIHRRGIVHIADLAGVPGQGLDPNALTGRQDEIHDVVAKGDRVWAIWTVRATHTGVLYDALEPTGKDIAMLEVGVWRIADGKIAEAWFFADELGLLVDLGRSIPVR